MSLLRDAAHTLRPPAGDRHGPLVPMMVALTVVTGLVDAVSYLTLGHVFVANMTGNVVFLGFALAGASGLSAPASLAALGAFLVGALLAGRIGARTDSHRARQLRAAGAVQVSLIAIALLISLTAPHAPTGATRYALLVSLALAMGVQNAVAQRLAVPELTTTVLTRTLTGIASEAALAARGSGAGAQAGRRLVAVAAMLAGAAAGALLALEVSLAAALAPAFICVLVVALCAHALSRSSAAWVRA